jgi:hypothetical protein
MVIRSIRQHVASHNWFAVTVDVVIVVIGVFLGTQANNWNESRIERAAAGDYRQQIIKDLENNETDMSSRSAYYAAARKHALSALAQLDSGQRPADEQFLVDAFQASQVWLRPLVRNGYDEMTGAGLSHGIGDQGMRSRLAAYYTQIRQFDMTALSSTPYREKLRRSMPYNIQAAIQMRCGDQIRTMADGDQIAALPDRCELGLDPATIAVGESRLAAAVLEPDLTRLIVDIDQKMAGFERFRRNAHRLRVDLEVAARR